MGVGDHQLHPSQAAADQAAEELPPERFGLGRAHIQPMTSRWPAWSTP